MAVVELNWSSVASFSRSHSSKSSSSCDSCCGVSSHILPCLTISVGTSGGQGV